jgi:hypothetical protein
VGRCFCPSARFEIDRVCPYEHAAGGKTVSLNPARFAPFPGLKGDERAQHVATTPEPLARDRDN